jgi:cytochrome c oxidase subunit II
VSTSTVVVNGALIYILAFTALLFFLIIFFMIYFLVRYRKSRNPVPENIKGNNLLEALWVIVPTLLAMTFFIYGLTGFNFLRTVPAGSLKIKVHARQWSWLFEYSNGKKSPELIVPIGRNIECDLDTADVIHGFYVPAFRVQQDIIPLIPTRVWFNAIETGSYDIFCSQYCGLKHSAMTAKLIAVIPEQFDSWLAGKNINIAVSSLPASMPAGQRLILERGCASCHSLDGSRLAGPTFKSLYGSTVDVVSEGVQKRVTADTNYIRESILSPGKDVVAGYPNIMPSGKDILSDKEINEIINTIQKMK